MFVAIRLSRLLLLVFFEQNVSPEYQYVHFCHQEAAVCILGRAHDGFAAYVEAGVDYDGTPGFVVKAGH